VYKKLNDYLRDAQSTIKDHIPVGTFYRKFPKVCIDHIYLSANIDVLNIEVPRTKIVKMASDHLPLVVDLSI
jgi:endonuclease/exonuclease/phosphatase family metal-dependent hydrolase